MAMKDPCERCQEKPVSFIAVSRDYKRMLEVCDDCFLTLSDEGNWYFSPAEPELTRKPSLPKSA
jgi:protein-arginine kinase activator protein McsA